MEYYNDTVDGLAGVSHSSAFVITIAEAYVAILLTERGLRANECLVPLQRHRFLPRQPSCG